MKSSCLVSMSAALSDAPIDPAGDLHEHRLGARTELPFKLPMQVTIDRRFDVRGCHGRNRFSIRGQPFDQRADALIALVAHRLELRRRRRLWRRALAGNESGGNSRAEPIELSGGLLQRTQ